MMYGTTDKDCVTIAFNPKVDVLRSGSFKFLPCIRCGRVELIIASANEFYCHDCAILIEDTVENRRFHAYRRLQLQEVEPIIGEFTGIEQLSIRQEIKWYRDYYPRCLLSLESERCGSYE